MLFELGQITATREIVETLSEKEIQEMINFHANGQWGDLGKFDKKANDDAIKQGDRILSCYHYRGEKIYVITEWDRSLTTILFADQY